ncbi:MAG: hypothetical protein JXB32_05975, partial [Deltaproteobacteria bacterium]|nr:hypothetical protein [Deltaproteobacteria bacterium]
MRNANGWWKSGAACLLAASWSLGIGVGCGDDDGDPDADAPVDGDVGADADADADADVPGEAEADEGVESDIDAADDGGVDVEDVEADGDVPDVPAAMNALVVLTSDYSAGGLALIDLDTLGGTPVVVTDALAVHGDAMLSCVPAADGTPGGTFHVVERLGSDRVRLLRLTASGVEVLGALELEDGTNPQDAVSLSVGQVAVPQYERNGLVFAAGDLSGVEQTVDLEPLADGVDGICEMHRAVEDGGRLYVSLQLLDRGGASWV